VIIFLSFAQSVVGFEETSCLNATDKAECCKDFEQKIWQYGLAPAECWY
jgi:hypothetical protein